MVKVNSIKYKITQRKLSFSYLRTVYHFTNDVEWRAPHDPKTTCNYDNRLAYMGTIIQL